MQRVHYAGAIFITGDDIADGIVDYVHALAMRGGCATLTVPVRLNDGGVSSATLLVGPSSQLVVTPETSPFDELSSPELLTTWQHDIEAIA